MLPGPVFSHELRTVARKPRFYVIRSLCGLFLLYFFVTSSWRWNRDQELSIADLSSIGSGLFMMVLWLQALAAVFLTPALVAGTIAEDRQRKILLYLLASPLSNGEIVLGKLLVRLLYLVILVLVGFPIMSLALLLGGVDPAMLALAEAGVFSIIFLLGSVSIYLSGRFKRPRDAIVCAYAIVFAWLMLPVFQDIVVADLANSWPLLFEPVEWLLGTLELSAPTGVFGISSSNGLAGAAYWMIGLNSVAGLALLVPTIRGLRRREQDEGKGRKGWLFGARDLGRAWTRRRPFSLDDPMLWKECTGRFLFRNRATRLLVFALKALAVWTLILFVLTYAWPAFQESYQLGYGQGHYNDARFSFNVGIRIGTVGGYLLLVLLLSAVSAGCITSEKEKDSWISLISTPMDGTEILRGKILGALWSARYLFAGLLLLWIVGVIAGSLHPIGFILLLVATPVYSAFTVALGVHYSSICRTTTRALVATFATLLFLNGGYLMCCVPIVQGGGGAMPLTFILSFSGMSVLVEAFAACTYPEVSSFLQDPGVGLDQGTHLAMVLTYLFSVGGYSIAAFLLLQNRIASFDDDAGRPRRVYGHYYGPKSPQSEPAPPDIDVL